jgi:thiol-disulfide isomerase/thioredoxin
LNRRSEVCGLLNSGDDKTSVFISFAAVREAWLACQALSTKKPTLYVFGSSTCGPCVAFKRDYAEDAELRRRLDERFAVVFVDVDRHPEMARHFGIERIPVFVVPGQSAESGYEGREELLKRLGLTDNHTSPPQKTTEPAPTPESDEESNPPREPEEAVVAPAPAPAETDAAETPPVPSVPANQSDADPIDRLSAVIQTAVSVATWLGVGGLTGGTGGLILGGLALWRTLRRRRQAPSARDSPETPSPFPPRSPSVVTVESPPPPQAIVPETRFAPYERDTFAEAFAWAEAEMVRKYPGAVSTLEAMKGLINQFLASRGYRPQASGSRKEP